jgi:hypothetical protein
MSYTFNNPCWNCKKHNNENPCKDEAKIRAAINEIHGATDGSHQGAGEVLLMCCKQDTESK